jgi:hypothetical protein
MRAEFCLESLMGGDHSEDQGLDGRIDLKEVVYEGVVWIHVTEDSGLL